MRILLRLLHGFFVLAVGGIGGGLFGRCRKWMAPLHLPGLQQEVTVERDIWGIPHIRAASLEDMAEAQGYVMAQDRLWQMDLLRRVARGQLSEILGTCHNSSGQTIQTVAIWSRRRNAIVESTGPRNRAAYLQAYARGVNKFIEQHQNKLPIEFTMLEIQARSRGGQPIRW